MIYIEIAEEMGISYGPCGVDRWIRKTHIITASTKKDLKKQKEEIEKYVEESDTYQSFSIYLCKWQTLEEYN